MLNLDMIGYSGDEDLDVLRSKLGAAAQKRASELPSWEDTARLLFDELRAVVSEARM